MDVSWSQLIIHSMPAGTPRHTREGLHSDYISKAKKKLYAGNLPKWMKGEIDSDLVELAETYTGEREQ